MIVLSFMTQDGSDVHSTLSNLKLLCHDLPSEIIVDICQCSRGCMKTMKALELSDGKIRACFCPTVLESEIKIGVI